MWWYHCIVMGLPFMLPSLNSSPFNAKKCSWAPKKTIFKRSYIDFYCGEEITLSSSSYFSESESKNRKEFQRCRLSVVQALANEKLILLPEKWMKATFRMQSHSLLTTSCPVFPYIQWNPASSLCSDKRPDCCSCQLAHRATEQWH